MTAFYCKAFCATLIGACAPIVAVSVNEPQSAWQWIMLGAACIIGGASSLKAYLSKAAGNEPDP